jgi:Zn-dependent metalloprotease
MLRVGPIEAPASWFAEIKEKVTDVTVSEGDGTKIERYKHSNEVRSIAGRFEVFGASSPKDAAERYLQEHAEDFGIRADLGDLRILFQRVSEVESKFDYQRLYDGVPIFGWYISVAVTNRNIVTRVGSAESAVPLGFDAKPRLSLDDARRIAQTEFSKGVRAVHGSISLSTEPGEQKRAVTQPFHEFGVLIRDGQPYAAWRIELVNTAATGAWEVFLDDRTKQLVHVNDLVEWE